MKKQFYEIINGQTCSLSRGITIRATDNQTWSRFIRFGRTGCEPWGQFTIAALAAGLLHHLAAWSGDVAAMLNVLTAVSAFAYIGLATQSRSGAQALFNVLASPFIFTAGYAGFQGGLAWLAISFALHGIISALQIKYVDQDLQSILFLWAVFCGSLVILLIIG